MVKTIKLKFKKESYDAIKEGAKCNNQTIIQYCKYIIESEVYMYKH